jgi:molybdenum cofactor cytidylyltransferase
MAIQSYFTNFSAIVLAAGKSSRMGVPKFTLMFDEKYTFLETLVNCYADFGCNEIIIVLNNEGAELFSSLENKLPSNARVVVNYHPEWERFYSLMTAAKALEKINPVFVSNIDNPFINREVLDKLAVLIKKCDYVFPSFRGRGGHPFMISEKVISDIIKETVEQLNMKDFLNRYPKEHVDVNDERILLNINTEEDYKGLKTNNI